MPAAATAPAVIRPALMKFRLDKWVDMVSLLMGLGSPTDMHVGMGIMPESRNKPNRTVGIRSTIKMSAKLPEGYKKISLPGSGSQWEATTMPAAYMNV